MHSTIVKKVFLFPTFLMAASLACTVQLAATAPTETSTTPITQTLVSTQGLAAITSIPVTVVSTQVPAVSTPTQIPATQLAHTAQPTIGVGTTVTYRPLTLVIPPDIASGASANDIQRVDSDAAAGWQEPPVTCK